MSNVSANSPSSPADWGTSSVVILSAEQARAAWVELRDDKGGVVGYLARQGGENRFFSPQEMETIRQRAQTPPVGGKTFAEIVDSVRLRVEAAKNQVEGE